MDMVGEWSPSSRRAWVEICPAFLAKSVSFVALLAEGVGRNLAADLRHLHDLLSPSSRRAWVEIAGSNAITWTGGGRPPHGGRG